MNKRRLAALPLFLAFGLVKADWVEIRSAPNPFSGFTEYGGYLIASGGTGGRRIFLSDDYGITWQQQQDTLQSAAWPLDGRGPYLFAARNSLALSLDTGKTWNRSTGIDSVMPPLTNVWALAVTDSFVYAGDNAGMVEDSGTSFLYRSPLPHLNGGRFSWVRAGYMRMAAVEAILPYGNGVLAAGDFSLVSNSGGVWQCNALGDSCRARGLQWASVYTLAAQGSYVFAGTPGGRTATSGGVMRTLAASADTTWTRSSIETTYSITLNGNALFASTGADDPPTRQIIKVSMDYGNTWADISGSLPLAAYYDPLVVSGPYIFAPGQASGSPFRLFRRPLSELPLSTRFAGNNSLNFGLYGRQMAFTLPHRALVQLGLYDLRGKAALQVSTMLEGGRHEIPLNGVSGPYIITLNAGSQTLTQRVFLP